MLALARTSVIKERLKVGFVSGERGIGKSSLVSYVRHIAERQHNMAAAHVHLGSARSLDDMVRCTFDAVLQDGIDRPWYEQVKEYFGKAVETVGLFGVSVKLNLAPKDLSTVANNFIPAIRELLKQLKKAKRDGLLLILDDINGLAKSPDFVHWLKSMVDTVATEQKPLPLCIIVVGLEERRREMMGVQPSIGRIFELVKIAQWSLEETTDFYRKIFTQAGAKIAANALQYMALCVDGFPSVAHEIGDAVWRTADGPSITFDNALAGTDAGIRIIGEKLIEPQILATIRSEKYNTILRKIVENDINMYIFGRAELKEILTDAEQKVLGNFFRKMVEIGLFQTDAETRGQYSVSSILYMLFLTLHFDKEKKS